MSGKRFTASELELLKLNHRANNDGSVSSRIINELLDHIEASVVPDDIAIAAMPTPVAADLTRRLSEELMRRLTAMQTQRGIIKG